MAESSGDPACVAGTIAVAPREVGSGPDDAADPHVRVVEDVSALVGGSDADAGVVVHVSVRIDASDPDAGVVVDVRDSGHVGASRSTMMAHPPAPALL
jgi:hypothetical protein